MSSKIVNQSYPRFETTPKKQLYRIAFPFGFADTLVALRSQKPSAADMQTYYCARQKVRHELAKMDVVSTLDQVSFLTKQM